MRGKGCAALVLGLCAGAWLAADAGAEDAPAAPAAKPNLSPTVIVLDASKSMSEKLGDKSKIEAVRSALGEALGTFGGKLSFGLVAFGHRKKSNCADTETLAKPGDLDATTQAKLLGGIKAVGEAPIAAALSEAANWAAYAPDGKLDIVVIADGKDSCDAELCASASALKEKSKALRIHVIGIGAEPEDLEPLSCVVAATGGEFVAAIDAREFKNGLATVLNVVANAPPPSAQTETQASDGAGEPVVKTVKTVTIEAPHSDDSPGPQDGDAQASDPRQSEIHKSAPSVAPAAEPAAKIAANKPEAPVPSAPPATAPSTPLALAQPAPGAKPPPSPHADRPVPVTFKALVTETGPKLENGLTWRVYAAKAGPDGEYKLISTHREAMPTAALLPGDYLVNAAYGLSNLTKKIKVEGGRSIEESFVLNTGGLKLAATFSNGEPMPEASIRFDIMSDEEDQFGNRRKILGNAKPGTVIRLNAGAYHIVSVYGDANATVRADVTVEPGKVTEATVRHNGAKITFKLVQSLGGEALADTKWKILTSAGDLVKENAGALPTHILAPGSYAVVADHASLNYTRKFSIEAGETKQIEVVVDDGPTSPEVLKALLEPPEPPPAAEYAGEGAMDPNAGFGFSSGPADPNAPLINPGALFRSR
jgi:Mg-chelatase subunit ChlD